MDKLVRIFQIKTPADYLKDTNLEDYQFGFLFSSEAYPDINYIYAFSQKEIFYDMKTNQILSSLLTNSSQAYIPVLSQEAVDYNFRLIRELQDEFHLSIEREINQFNNYYSHIYRFPFKYLKHNKKIRCFLEQSHIDDKHFFNKKIKISQTHLSYSDIVSKMSMLHPLYLLQAPLSISFEEYHGLLRNRFSNLIEHLQTSYSRILSEISRIENTIFPEHDLFLCHTVNTHDFKYLSSRIAIEDFKLVMKFIEACDKKYISENPHFSFFFLPDIITCPGYNQNRENFIYSMMVNNLHNIKVFQHDFNDILVLLFNNNKKNILNKVIKNLDFSDFHDLILSLFQQEILHKNIEAAVYKSEPQRL